METCPDVIRVILRALLSLVTLFLVTKLIGKKQISELSLFDYVIGISIGNFAAEMTINLDSHFLHGTVAVIIFGIVAYIISLLTMKSITLRRFFSGVPTVIIEKGILLEEGLKKCKYDINDLLEQARCAGYYDLNEIYYAIMEANGSISFLAKKMYSSILVKDMNLKLKEQEICKNVIIDGKYMKKNMIDSEFNYVKKEIKIRGKCVEDILLATLDEENKLTIYLKNNKKVDSYLE